MLDLPTTLENRLATRSTTMRMEWDARPAAVLVPLYQHNQAWHLLLTQRTNDVPSHKGQVAFPGGRMDTGDASLVETALRETEEEIGLPRSQVRVIGQLDELLTVTQYRVTPVVGIIPWPWAFVPSPGEIAAIFGVPLSWLAQPTNLTEEWREPFLPGQPIKIYHFYYGEFDIWGATARIICNLLEVLEK